MKDIKPNDALDKTNTEAPEEEKSHTLFGFWAYIMTDCVLFASLFATYIVLHNNTVDGGSASELFDMNTALTETIVLLVSSFTVGLALIATHARKRIQTYIWLAITFILGVVFLHTELSEFSEFVASGNSWQESGFLSSFFTLVGTHGIHITIGLIWIIVMIAQLLAKGFKESVIRRITTLSLFWHFLDVVWIFIFTLVYLMGEINL